MDDDERPLQELKADTSDTAVVVPTPDAITVAATTSASPADVPYEENTFSNVKEADHVETANKQELIEESTSNHCVHVPENGDLSNVKKTESDDSYETREGVRQQITQLSLENATSNNEIVNGSDSANAKAVSETDHNRVSQIHQLKWIPWCGKKTAIVTQNENGPCPLIAIANILLLRGKIKLPGSIKYVTAADLLEYIGDSIMDNVLKDLPGVNVLNYEQNMHDAIAVLPHLHTGLDVNVKFTGVRHFEYTSECIIFDLLNIPLYHGWLVDPQCVETVAALGSLGYNQLVERIIINKCSSNTDLVTQALIAEEFLERTASQLTYHGLCELNSTMKHEELAVLFRNNHFSTIVKKKVCVCTEDAESQLLAKEELHELFQLVTDQGFLHEPRVVWETLCSIDGDGQFVDGQFVTVPPKTGETYLPERDISEQQQINHDYLVALSLQEDQKKEETNEHGWEEFKQAVPGTHDVVSDKELAHQLQEDRQRHARVPPSQAQAGQPSSQMGASLGLVRHKKGVCTVL